MPPPWCRRQTRHTHVCISVCRLSLSPLFWMFVDLGFSLHHRVYFQACRLKKPRLARCAKVKPSVMLGGQPLVQGVSPERSASRLGFSRLSSPSVSPCSSRAHSCSSKPLCGPCFLPGPGAGSGRARRSPSPQGLPSVLCVSLPSFLWQKFPHVPWAAADRILSPESRRVSGPPGEFCPLSPGHLGSSTSSAGLGLLLPMPPHLSKRQEPSLALGPGPGARHNPRPVRPHAWVSGLPHMLVLPTGPKPACPRAGHRSPLSLGQLGLEHAGCSPWLPGKAVSTRGSDPVVSR